MAIDQNGNKLDVPGVPEDMPVFVMRADDSLAVDASEHYLAAQRFAIGTQYGKDDRDAAKALSQRLSAHVHKLQRWPGRKTLPKP